MEVDEDILERLTAVLKSFLNPNYRMTNEAYLEMLITHLNTKKTADNNGDQRTLLTAPYIMDWICECLDRLEKDRKSLNPNIVSFMINLADLVMKNEWLIYNVKERNLPTRIHTFLSNNEDMLTASMKLAHVRWLLEIISHAFGVAFVKQRKLWQPAINYCMKNQTVYVVREASAFVFEILYIYSVKCIDEDFCLEILSQIVAPIQECVYSNDAVTVCVDDAEFLRKMIPPLNLLIYILTNCVRKEARTRISEYLEDKFDVRIGLWKLADMTHDDHLLGLVIKAMTCLNFARLCDAQIANKDVSMESYDFNGFGVTFFNLMKFCLQRRSLANLLSIAELNHILWQQLTGRVPEDITIENDTVKFQNQLILYHILPLLFIAKETNLDQTEILDSYILKVVSISCELSVRICYMFRDVIYDNPNIVEVLACKSVNGILAMDGILDQDRAVIVFQAMIYGLKEFAPEGCMYGETTERTNDDLVTKFPNLLAAILAGLQKLIKKFRITWKESLESTSLLNFMLVLLQNQNLSTRQAVEAIKLTQVSIEYFLSPHLALLVDNFNGSGMEDLGPMIKKRLHDTAWEVRDSTVELVTSMTSISKMKFPAFQKLLIDHGICPIIIAMAQNDFDSYVRAASFCCLSEMVGINHIYDRCLASVDLIDHLLITLYNEPEAIVRRAAVNLVVAIYDFRSISGQYLEYLYSTLAYCAVDDLDWEVKIKALLFWKLVLIRQFTDQGMIDGHFPSVTFSKQFKKIVTIDEKEILRRTQTALERVSKTGCLGVFIKASEDDSDLEVVKVSIKYTKTLVEFFQRHEYWKLQEKYGSSIRTSVTITSPHTNAVACPETEYLPDLQPMMVDDSTSGELQACEEVIESIVKDHDMNLLVNAYDNQLHLSDADLTMRAKKKINVKYFLKFTNVSVQEYLKFLQTTDFNHIINRRDEWMKSTESLSSLLDDMLFSVRKQGTNDADCY